LVRYNKAFLAATNHAIGKSILMGSAAQAPAPSWKAAVDYTLAYGKAIWQAMMLGLLLGLQVDSPILRFRYLRVPMRPGGPESRPATVRAGALEQMAQQSKTTSWFLS
jgi:hypothetical protein